MAVLLTEVLVEDTSAELPDEVLSNTEQFLFESMVLREVLSLPKYKVVTLSDKLLPDGILVTPFHELLLVHVEPIWHWDEFPDFVVVKVLEVKLEPSVDVQFDTVLLHGIAASRFISGVLEDVTVI